jgi:DNA repair ATPase RecN
MESTYGGHQRHGDMEKEIFSFLATLSKESRVGIVASFAVARAQQFIYLIYEFFQRHPEYKIRVVLDSPMMNEANRVYQRFSHLAKDGEELRYSLTEFEVIDHAREWESLKKKEEERVQRLAFIQFQIEELNEANLQLGEDESLSNEKKLLQSSEQRMQLVAQIDSALDGEDGAMNALRIALNKAKALAQMDESVLELYRSLERALAEVDESSRMARSYLSRGDLSPERLEAVQERLSMITNFKRKYGSTLTSLLIIQSSPQKWIFSPI